MSFYEATPSKALRFGDIVSGFVFSTTNIDSPSESPPPFNIEVVFGRHAVVMSPSCSISHKTISLAPLKKIDPNFFRNPHLEEDVTRLNREMDPRHTLPPQAWEKMDEDEKQRRLAKKSVYIWTDLFVYQSHPQLPEYKLKRGADVTNVTLYMIDFREIQQIKCKGIQTPEDSPLDAKLLELSVRSRADLRDKLLAYYARVAEEDAAAIM